MRKLSVALWCIAAAALLAQESSPYRVTNRFALGGDGSWDYIVPDPPNHRVFIGRQNRVMVVDEDRGALLGEVPGIQGAHGTAIAAASGHGFATSGNDQSVVMFDLKSCKVLGRIPAAERRGRDHLRRTVESGLHVQRRRPFVDGDRPGRRHPDRERSARRKARYGASAGDGKIYANLTDTSEVVEIEGKTATVTRRWSTAPCKQPVAMAIDVGHHRLFSGCRSGVLAVSDYPAGKVVATLPIGGGVDGAGYDAATGDVFASNADGTLTVMHQVDPDQHRVIGAVQTPPGSRNMGLDPISHRIFVAAAHFGPPPGGRGRGPVLPDSFTVMVIERAPDARQRVISRMPCDKSHEADENPNGHHFVDRRFVVPSQNRV